MLNRFMILCWFAIAAMVSSCVQPGNSPETPTLKNSSISVQQVTTDSVITDFQAAGARLLSEEQVGQFRIGAPFKNSLDGWTLSAKTLWEADGLFHRSCLDSKSGMELNLSSGDSTFAKAVISSITITEPCTLETKSGIRIGSSYEAVRKAYGSTIDPQESNDSTLVAGSIYGGIIFTFEARKVSSIFLGAAAE